MLTDKEFDAWALQLGLTTKAKRLVEQARKEPPARNVGGRGGNMHGTFCSEKTGLTMEWESNSLELPGLYESEFDDDVLELYSQPTDNPLPYITKIGKTKIVFKTADLFELRQDSAGWVEWKKEDQLLVLAGKNPDRYSRDEHGCWHFRPGEQFAEEHGLFYVVRTEADVDPVRFENYVLLEDYLRDETPSVPDDRKDAFVGLVEGNPGVLLSEVFKSLPKLSVDEAFTLIAQRAVFVDLGAADLAQHDLVRLYATAQIAATYALVEGPVSENAFFVNSLNIAIDDVMLWDGNPWTVRNLGASVVSLTNADGAWQHLSAAQVAKLVGSGTLVLPAKESVVELGSAEREILDHASPDAMNKALEHLAAIKPYLEGQRIPAGIEGERNLRNWFAKFREAERAFGRGFLGLIPARYKQGRRGDRIPKETVDLIDELLKSDYENSKGSTLIGVYGAIQNRCEEMGIYCPSWEWVRQRNGNRDRRRRTRARRGIRAAYQEREFPLVLDWKTSRHGKRPFQIVHIDHTLIDLQFLDSKLFKNIGRAWLTVVIDAYTRRILAFVISFDPPSYRSCMLAIRELVRRYGRAPQFLVVDGGADFRSVYFDTLLALLHINKKVRAPHQPRQGSVMERIFGTANTEVIYTLSGNTQVTKTPRIVTKSNDPKNLAIWTLPAFAAHFGKWAYEVYDQAEHPSLGESPKAAYERGLTITGKRSHLDVMYDEQFKILTCPTTRNGQAMVIAGVGVKINYLYYWHESFRSAEIEGHKVAIRFDPWDASIAYAYVRQRWVECETNDERAFFRGRSLREIKHLTDELIARQKSSGKTITINAKSIARLAAEGQSDEVALQHLRDQELKRTHGLITGDAFAYDDSDGGNVGPFAPATATTGGRKPGRLNGPRTVRHIPTPVSINPDSLASRGEYL